ncbi:hypothetical protein [Crocosphaera chwakensis]|uniref:DUF2231 domain-containing protein n=1 Tax=Crocosphaera chwakensis CCY0110 TaxID=391612 RepID=A3IMF3_9CHRO|nr:hypothetical protein [Crocosphaera chwakensis]EAZ92322.1 hypothetical protein CY0110_28224 [Crocosphaera chwakensis CCY0110]
MNLNSAHIHLLLNHFPIVGAIFGLLLLIYSIFKTSDDLKQASYWTFIIVALLTIPTYIYGEQAADIVLNVPNVTEAYVHKHEELAEVSLITLEILGTLSIVGLFFSSRTKKTVNWLTMIILAIAIIGTVLVSWTGLQGGIIRHTEVRGDILILTPDHSDTEEQNNHSHE